MEIPLDTKVECTDGFCGKSEYILINPILDRVTHLVVKEDTSPHIEYIVPVEFVSKTENDLIRLSCSKEELEEMDPFISTTFIEEPVIERNTEYIGQNFMGDTSSNLFSKSIC